MGRAHPSSSIAPQMATFFLKTLGMGCGFTARTYKRRASHSPRPGPCQTRSHVRGITQDASGVTAKFANGHEERGDLLLGADGIRSKVRDQLLGSSQPRYTGSIAWRGVTQFEHPDLVNNLEFWGRGSRFGVFALGGGRTYWYGTRRVPEGFFIPPDERQRELLAHYRGWHDPVTDVIAASGTIIQTDIYDRRPSRRWGEGRVTLLGDGAHAMTADVGQGCAQVLRGCCGCRPLPAGASRH